MGIDIAALQQQNRQLFLSKIPQALACEPWSDDLLCHLNTKCNFSLNYYLVLFPGGLTEIATAYEQWQDQIMYQSVSELPGKIRQKIALALRVRITIGPKAALLNQNSYFMLPNNLAQGLRCAAKTCDIIWRLAGDQSTDFNYYTKRALLLPVYLSAQAYYLTDDSSEHHKMKEFIDSSLNSIITVFETFKKCRLPESQNIPILRLFS